MRCLTCGKRIHVQMKECPNCGAMIPPPAPAAKTQAASSAAGSAAGKDFDWKSVLTPNQQARPPFGGGSLPPPQARPAQPVETGEEMLEEVEQETRPAAPKAPAWTQYIFPTIIMLWVAFRMFGPNIERLLSGKPWDEEASTRTELVTPELRRVLLCQKVDEQGNPVNARETFSRSNDQAVTVLTAWTGSMEGQTILFNWRSPSGKLLAGAQSVLHAADPPPRFGVVGTLPLGEFAEAGRWSIEVLLNDTPVGSREFTVEQ